jgi:hypothetical protein
MSPSFGECWSASFSQTGIAPVVEAARLAADVRKNPDHGRNYSNRWAESSASFSRWMTLKPSFYQWRWRRRIEIPAPALLLAVKVKNDLLYDHIAGQLKSIRRPPSPRSRPEDVLDAVAAAAADSIGADCGQRRSYFPFATSSELVRTVQEVRQGKQAGAEKFGGFQNTAKHLRRNQFVYVARRLSEMLADLQGQRCVAAGCHRNNWLSSSGLFGADKPTYSLSVSAHTTTGWHSTSVGSQDSASAVLLAPTIGVSAIAAGMVLPALARRRLAPKPSAA